jgi:hypothetical protein
MRNMPKCCDREKLFAGFEQRVYAMKTKKTIRKNGEYDRKTRSAKFLPISDNYLS